MITRQLMTATSSVVVFIDHQAKLMPAIYGADDVIADAARLAEIAKLLGIAVIGTEQNPDKLGPLDSRIRRHCDAIVTKMHFDACADGLLSVIAEHAPDATSEVIICGCEAHVCLLQTALSLLAAGRQLRVVASACGSRFPNDFQLALSRLQASGASIVNSEMVLFEWLRTCEHPHFRGVLERIKARAIDRPSACAAPRSPTR